MSKEKFIGYFRLVEGPADEAAAPSAGV